jgi:hypothetical protein
MLDSSQESVTSALKRARATLQRRLPPSGNHEPPPPPHSGVEQELVERFTRAFETSDVDGIVALLTEDVLFSMPPLPYLDLRRTRIELLELARVGGRSLPRPSAEARPLSRQRAVLFHLPPGAARTMSCPTACTPRGRSRCPA